MPIKVTSFDLIARFIFLCFLYSKQLDLSESSLNMHLRYVFLRITNQCLNYSSTLCVLKKTFLFSSVVSRKNNFNENFGQHSIKMLVI